MIKVKNILKEAAKKKQLTPEMEKLLQKIQSEAIALVCDISELLSLNNREDPDSKKSIEKIENLRTPSRFS